MENNQVIFPNKHWENFYNKFKQIDILPLSGWKPIHFVAYICKRFQNHYGHPYAFTFKTAPGKCPEMYLVGRIPAILNTTDNSKIRDYIDWVWDRCIIPQKKNIRTLAYFQTVGLANTFLFEYNKKKEITRETLLPEEYQTFIDHYQVSANSYGDLVFIFQALKEDDTSEGRQGYNSLLNQLYILGLQKDLLEKLGTA